MKSKKYEPKIFRSVPFTDSLPAPIWFHLASMPADATYPQHHHDWGEFVYSFEGAMEIKLPKIHFLAPPPYGIWLPPNVEHRGLNRDVTMHSSIFLEPDLCKSLPSDACVLMTTPLLRVILTELKNSPPRVPCLIQQTRLLQVTLDQLEILKKVDIFLPTSEHTGLSIILNYLYLHPEDNSHLSDLARMANLTERTLARYCDKELGMSLTEWRQRLKIFKSLPMLETGQSIKTISLNLGYANTSAFINMFKRWMGTTPDSFRKESPSS
ncbi:AraC family transcriptional regulator [Acinetobacter sp. ABJ_C1_1]|uniref:AraC family transcriptional regulator n=1 Tax=Acinetobacter sp. ABJ_C1_1 TaxID=3378321 RepID=UPI00264BD592|nr:helix-turn-helix transcriptional regulator [Acinetobacter baumannii]